MKAVTLCNDFEFYDFCGFPPDCAEEKRRFLIFLTFRRFKCQMQPDYFATILVIRIVKVLGIRVFSWSIIDFVLYAAKLLL